MTQTSVFSTSNAQVLMPRSIADGMITEARSLSTVAKLSGREPMRFGDTDILIFNDFPKAEFVGEGAQKGPTSGGFDSVTVKPYKAQVTMRFNQEVLWADEDYQLSILSQLAEQGKIALSRALDLGLYHRINPVYGTTIDTWSNYIDATKLRVQPAVGARADEQFEAAVGLLVNSDVPVAVNGAAFSLQYSWDLANLKEDFGAGAPSSRPAYPDLGFGTNVSSFRGVPVAQGDTVSGGTEAVAGSPARNVAAIVGDFQNGIRWGVQRELPVELIRFGDPDGQGDLKRHNQIALRLEIAYGWYAFVDRFAVIEKPATADDDEGA